MKRILFYETSLVTYLLTAAAGGICCSYERQVRRNGRQRRPSSRSRRFIRQQRLSSHQGGVLCIVYTYDTIQTRRALGGVHLPPTKLFPRLAENKTILKPRVAAELYYVWKIPRTCIGRPSLQATLNRQCSHFVLFDVAL